ncbi:MAG: rRNA maturation RNase YbeY [Paramuribaculum sp.]|nr:rRNA maturation RNase YbeY [Paramuribaculum sp.]MDE6304229.1 rRNA maturation RNase YbeY [Paramuribaculum sp.]
MPALDFEKVETWLCKVADNHGFEMVRVNYLLTDDANILDYNIKYLNHSYFTDIITFDYTSGNRIAGDIVISLDTVRSNAAQLGVDYRSELLRVIVHGVLHLCGINDKLPGEREIMEQNENEALELFNQCFS